MSEMSSSAHWKTEKLGKLCRVYSGYAFKTSNYSKKGIPIIKIGNLQDGEVIINPNNDCVPESWQQKEELQRFILKSEDILIALTGATTGKTAVVYPSLTGTFLNQRVGKIELISPHAQQGFVLMVTKTRFFQQAIQQSILRSAQGNISPSSIAQIPIPLPPLPEQRAIASVLGAIQDAKLARQKEIALERERKAALMDVLFSHGTKGEPRKQTEIGEIPESWEVVQLKEIAGLRRENINPKANLGLNYVGLEHIDSGESQLKRWGDATEVKSAKSRFYPNDVLYGKLRSYLDKAVLAGMEGICSTDILVVTSNSRTTPRFLVYLLHNYALISHAVATSTGVNHPRTSWNALGKFTLALPSISEQHTIAGTFQAIDEKVAALERETALLDELFHAMLEELMTGKRSATPLIDLESQN